MNKEQELSIEKLKELKQKIIFGTIKGNAKDIEKIEQEISIKLRIEEFRNLLVEELKDKNYGYDYDHDMLLDNIRSFLK
jgi:hypothetical protein